MSDAALNLIDGLPGGLADCRAQELAGALGGPALLRLPGKRNPPLLVSVLLHGNEDSGWNGLRRLLREPGGLPRSLIVFIGNVTAAAAGVRTLPRQQDYNRIWRGATGPEGRLAAAVMRALNDDELFAAIDLHNNTGHNPHYAVLTDPVPANLGLARMFSDRAVLVSEPDSVLTRRFDGRCPAMTVELGPIGDPRCDDRAYDLLHRCLDLEAPPPAPGQGDLELFEALGRVHVAEEAEFSFAGDGHDTPLVLTGGVEGVNFHELPAGAEFGVARAPLERLLRVLDPRHRDVTDAWFAIDRGRLLLRRAVVPAMYTTDPTVIRQDCLCYFMQRIPEAAVIEHGVPARRR